MAEDSKIEDVSATTSPLPSMYEPDEPEVVEADTDAEPAEVEADEPDESGESVEPEADEATDDTEQPDEPPADAKPHNRDKAIQQMQQRQATFEKQTREQIDGVQSTLRELLDTIKAQGGKATPDQKAEVEDAKDELDDLLATLEGEDAKDDVLTGDQLATAIKTLRKKLTNATESSAVKELRQELDSLKAQQSQAEYERQWYASFDRENPDLAGQGMKLVAKARQKAESEYPELKGKPDFNGVLAVVWKQVLVEAKGTKSRKTVLPASTKPPKSTEGTQTVQSGASGASRTTTLGKKAKPPLWVED